MPRRSPDIDPELKAHQEWLGYLPPVGLVVIPAAIVDAGWVVTRSGELFFWDAGEAVAFESQLRSCEAIKGRKKLPWRYRWQQTPGPTCQGSRLDRY